MDQTKIKYISGTCAGVISVSIFHPIDTLRVRSFLHTNNKTNVPISKTLLNGFAFNLTTTTLKTVISFPIRDSIYMSLINNNIDKNTANISSSMISGVMLGLAATPINVVKINIQNNDQKQTSLKVIKEIYKKQNRLSDFFKGCSATLMRDMTYNTSYFFAYSVFDNYFKTNPITTLFDNRILASFLSSIIATSFGYPFDGIRIFRQTNIDSKNGYWHGFKMALAFNRNNFNSYFLTVLRVPVSNVITHMSYLYVCEFLTKYSSK